LTADHLSADPAWSADGTAIAFTNIRDGNPSLYVMRPDGSGVRRLTQPAPGTHDAEPTWQR
jgi:Tol biopolymer transport system component